MPFKTIFLYSVFLFYSLNASAQNEGANWTFGRGCGLHFAPNGTITQFASSVFSREGVATATDPATGKLLFYSDGTQVWDATHSTMFNGSGLLGNYSSAQSAVIVPMPGDSLRYYLITAPVLNGIENYYYSIVNMAANNGLGVVEYGTKNTLLLANGTEKIGLARHCNTRDFWLILRESGSNNFQVYLIDESGIHAPQKFSLGANLEEGTWNETGYLRVSNDDKMLVHAIGHDLSGNGSAVELFHFDNATGVLAGPFVTMNNIGLAYGVEFSANNKLLYLSDIKGLSAYPSAVYQYDLSSGNAQTIIDSRIQLIASSEYGYGALQLAPDGKIYVAKEHGYDNGSFFLDVIGSPSVAGSGCNYLPDGLPLTIGTTLIGLPHADYRPYHPPPLTVVPLCANDTFYVDGLPYTAPDTVTDYSSATSICAIPIRYRLVEMAYQEVFQQILFCPGESVSIGGTVYTQPAVFTDTLNSSSGCDTILTISLAYRPLPQIARNLVLCPGESITINDSLYEAPASVTDTIFNPTGCDTLRVNTLLPAPLPSSFLGPDQLLCAGDHLLLNSSYEHTVWNGTVVSPTFPVTEPGWITAEAQDENGCLVRDSLLVEGCCNQKGLYVPNVFSPNDDGLNDEFCVFPSPFCTQYSLRIYDRWGELIFETQAPGQCWNGRFRNRLMPPGVYVWTIEITGGKQPGILKGDVTLVR